MRFKITISDTVTYARRATIAIEATSEAGAQTIADEWIASGLYPPNAVGLGTELGDAGREFPAEAGTLTDFDEEETDNTPWEIEIEPA